MSEVLTAETIATIDHWLNKYPTEQRRSTVIAALTAAQKQNQGWLNTEFMDAVANYLEIPKTWVYEVATFYDMYYLKPVGQRKIRVCTNISCMLRGSTQIVEHLQKRLNINIGETTADGKFFLKEAECLAACANAPVMQIDLDYYENLTPKKIDQILQ